ncbi:SMP-30/gluconolactonase/LRE family protein [Thalassoroseus pseudoceratinae]|uniref:SMP-30/gluconolactonase/LRE family protein n=1 Tax=Thalassoroseus pseudoceratinae TaxID=2713176 RepID=UPI001F0EA1B1|nr:SMP-30/gluconolactonase/LRE family protein [Thalassoroseus pseudoceratinae]
MRMRSAYLVLTLAALTTALPSAICEELSLTLRSQSERANGEFEFREQTETWKPEETAIIVCDVWDLHHSLNAVKRLEQFAPRLDRVLKKARSAGVTIIHSPSDCMDAYAEHSARKRAQEAPIASRIPFEIKSWCSVIPTEERAVYPIDQSDGGADDDPKQHAVWAAKLKSLGRNPGTPWKSQSALITIDSENDFISDRGDEVWNILESRGIQNVILTGVHVNMCVLGRPFGLRQMVRNGKHVVLMRDMTDSMYNPEQWPYVSHFEGTRRIISHIERYVCPTISSDQILGGDEFRFQNASADSESPELTRSTPSSEPADYRKHWANITVTSDDTTKSHDSLRDIDAPQWYRCVLRIPQTWLSKESLTLSLPSSIDVNDIQGWVNGASIERSTEANSLVIDSEFVTGDEANLLVLRLKESTGSRLQAPVLNSGGNQLTLAGRWQMRVGNDPTWANMPLPAKFGTTTDIVFQAEPPLFTPTPLTRPGEFTPGIEGPACDANGDIYAVNYMEQGTIGRVSPDGDGEVFVTLPEGSVGNGIRFLLSGDFYVADYMQHNILLVNAASRAVSVHAHHGGMNQPNDIAITNDGTLYASDPNWSEGTGQIWRIDRDGTVTKVASKMGTTNGIEVSPDGKTLYVNESKQRNIWAFDIAPSGDLSGERLVKKFADHGFDGMRCDVDGNLYVTRYGKGTVVKLSPSGQILQEIPVLGERPSNLCFGGPDGRTVYVTEVEFSRLVSIRVDRPGLSWTRMNKTKSKR